MARRSVLMVLLLLAACKPAAPESAANGDGVATPSSSLRPTSAKAPVAQGQWGLLASNKGMALTFPSADARPLIHLYCAAGSPQLLVNLARVQPVGSEERLSFGGGGEVVALVADPAGDRLRGGTSGRGQAPETLEAMLRAGPGASYGTNAIGPLPPVGAEDARRFAAACRKASAAPPPRSPCREQDGKAIAGPALRATGNEPFWSADIDGRCVTYATPERQAGVRVWTRFAQSGGVSTYAGALDGQPFRLEIRARPTCSDGMSDRIYPLAVALRIGGDSRGGCAAPR